MKCKNCKLEKECQHNPKHKALCFDTCKCKQFTSQENKGCGNLLYTGLPYNCGRGKLCPSCSNNTQSDFKLIDKKTLLYQRLRNQQITIDSFIYEMDKLDKEFILRLKEEIRETPNLRKYIVQGIIDKLAGADLTNE